MEIAHKSSQASSKLCKEYQEKEAGVGVDLGERNNSRK